MTLQWDESLVLGFEEIDNQHRSIFEQFQKLSDAIQYRESDTIIEQISSFLLAYTHMHFTAEDKIMVEYGYPNIETQRHEHGEFKQDANLLIKRIEQEGVTRSVALEITGKLFRWIIQHIKKHDKEMVSYIKEYIALKQKQES
jgi:hemerythrin